MNMHIAASLVGMTLCGTMCAQTNSDQAPSGTVVDKQHPDSNEVQPAPKKVSVTPDVIRAAQEKLSEEGYKPGAADGKMGPMTRAAIRKYRYQGRTSNRRRQGNGQRHRPGQQG